MKKIAENKHIIFVMSYSLSFSTCYIGSAYIWYNLTTKNKFILPMGPKEPGPDDLE